MRDILEAKRSTAPESLEADDIKIFFIDCFDKPIDNATAQFFDNHKIYRIVLPSNDVRNLIDPDGTTPKDSNEYRKHLFTRLFSYIAKDKYLDKNLAQTERESSELGGKQTIFESEAKGLSNSSLSKSKSGDKDRRNEDDKELIESYSLWSHAYTLSENLIGIQQLRRQKQMNCCQCVLT